VDGRAELGSQWVRFVGVDQFGMEFSVVFDCTDRELRNTQINNVMLMVHAAMANAGITLTAGQINNFMREDVGLTALENFSRGAKDYQKGDYERVRAISSNVYMESLKREVLLRRVRLFQPLPDEDIEVLATGCTRRLFSSGEYVVKAGEAGDSLFVITEGVARVEVTLADSSHFEAAKLGSGDIFGEMSLLTGEKRTADIVTTRPLVAFEISKEILRPILQNNPDLYDSLSQILAERKLDLSNIHAMSRDQFAEVKDLAGKLKSLIIRYFN
jgi:CRP-like cAMP-binding protein